MHACEGSYATCVLALIMVCVGQRWHWPQSVWCKYQFFQLLAADIPLLLAALQRTPFYHCHPVQACIRSQRSRWHMTARVHGDACGHYFVSSSKGICSYTVYLLHHCHIPCCPDPYVHMLVVRAETHSQLYFLETQTCMAECCQEA